MTNTPQSILGEPRWRRRQGLGIAGLGSAVVLWLGGLAPISIGVVMAAVVTTLVVGAGFMALALTCRHSTQPHRLRLAAIGVLCLLTVAVFVTRLFATDGDTASVVRRVAETPVPVANLRVVNLNVLHGYPLFADHEARFEALCDALRVLEPTVVTLQEVWATHRHDNFAQRLATELGMDVAYARANGRLQLIGFEEGSAVLSRLPILDAQPYALEPRFAFWDNRIALSARIATGPGEFVEIISKHLTPFDDEVNAQQARDLAARLPTGAFFVLAGDLNASSTSPSARALIERGLADLVPGGIDHVWVPEKPQGWRVVRADWTLRPDDMLRLVGRVLRLSDHPGIVVDLQRIVVESESGHGPRLGTATSDGD